MSVEQIDAMREDGVDVGIVDCAVPAWIADMGAASIWCLGAQMVSAAWAERLFLAAAALAAGVIALAAR